MCFTAPRQSWLQGRGPTGSSSPPEHTAVRATVREFSLFVVDCHAPNLHLQGFKTLDGRRAAEIRLDGVRVPAENLLGQDGAATDVLEHCRRRAIAAQCAEAIGAISELNKATLEYTKTRKQFGVPLGSFQVLQHRMVDMFVAQEEAVAIT